jgi:uncharacterized protein (DUF2235 family)
MMSAIRDLMSRSSRVEEALPVSNEGPRVHVVLIDGTASSIEEGKETNAGLTYKLLTEMADQGVTVHYEAGIQWTTWRHTRDIIEGRGINGQIRRVYAHLARNYRPGDRIFMFGYSRGAYAVRSLAGVLDRVGLVKAEHATDRNVMIAFRHYKRCTCGLSHKGFVRKFCHRNAPIEMLGVWDTVKSLGVRAPFLWRLTEKAHAFHNHALGHAIRHGYQALALNETREAFAPVLWDTPDDFPGHVEQVWFRGSHGDIGGQLTGKLSARPLSNIPLVWMLEKAEHHGLVLPYRWRERFPTDPCARGVGTWRGWGKCLLTRGRRRFGTDPSESMHPSALLGRSCPPVRSWSDVSLEDVATRKAEAS